MKIIMIIAALCLATMTAALIYGFVFGDFFAEGRALMAMPWGIVSLVDLYTGFALFSVWIIYRENSLPKSLIWVILMMVLGFFTASLYVLLAARTSRGDWDYFWKGNRI